MNIVQKQPNPSGAYSPPQSWNGATPPEGYVVIPDTLDMAAFNSHNGFVTPTIENNTVTSYKPNIEAWEAWKASLPEPKPPTMTTEEAILDKLTEIEYRQDIAALGLTGGETGE